MELRHRPVHNLFIAALIGLIIVVRAVWGDDDLIYKGVVVALMFWPAVVAIGMIALMVLWAVRERHLWLGGLASVLIALVGYAFLGRWVGGYGLGLFEIAHDVNARCAIRVLMRQPSELNNRSYEPGPIDRPRICDDIPN
ncbi:MAG: hypothetical protein ABI780_02125 [Ardenticatenales bacterium]